MPTRRRKERARRRYNRARRAALWSKAAGNVPGWSKPKWWGDLWQQYSSDPTQWEVVWRLYGRKDDRATPYPSAEKR